MVGYVSLHKFMVFVYPYREVSLAIGCSESVVGSLFLLLSSVVLNAIATDPGFSGSLPLLGVVLTKELNAVLLLVVGRAGVVMVEAGVTGLLVSLEISVIAGAAAVVVVVVVAAVVADSLVGGVPKENCPTGLSLSDALDSVAFCAVAPKENTGVDVLLEGVLVVVAVADVPKLKAGVFVVGALVVVVTGAVVDVPKLKVGVLVVVAVVDEAVFVAPKLKAEAVLVAGAPVAATIVSVAGAVVDVPKLKAGVLVVVAVVDVTGLVKLKAGVLLEEALVIDVAGVPKLKVGVEVVGALVGADVPKLKAGVLVVVAAVVVVAPKLRTGAGTLVAGALVAVDVAVVVGTFAAVGIDVTLPKESFGLYAVFADESKLKTGAMLLVVVVVESGALVLIDEVAETLAKVNEGALGAVEGAVLPKVKAGVAGLSSSGLDSVSSVDGSFSCSPLSSVALVPSEGSLSLSASADDVTFCVVLPKVKEGAAVVGEAEVATDAKLKVGLDVALSVDGSFSWFSLSFSSLLSLEGSSVLSASVDDGAVFATLSKEKAGVVVVVVVVDAGMVEDPKLKAGADVVAALVDFSCVFSLASVLLATSEGNGATGLSSGLVSVSFS